MLFVPQLLSIAYHMENSLLRYLQHTLHTHTSLTTRGSSGKPVLLLIQTLCVYRPTRSISNQKFNHLEKQRQLKKKKS